MRKAHNVTIVKITLDGHSNIVHNMKRKDKTQRQKTVKNYKQMNRRAHFQCFLNSIDRMDNIMDLFTNTMYLNQISRLKLTG